MSPKPWKNLIVVALMGVGCGAAFALSGSISAFRRPTQEFQPTIVNKTTSLEVVSATKTLIGQQYVLMVTLRNNSTKNILSYTYLAGHGSTTRDYTFGKEPLSPGKTDVAYVSYEDLQNSPISHKHPGHLVIVAAWFEGRSGDGDDHFVRKLSDQFEGLKQQAKLIVPLLRKAADLNEHNQDQALDYLISQAALLSTGDDNSDASIDYKEGRRRAQSYFVAGISEMKKHRELNTPVSQKALLAKHLELFERLESKF